MAEFYVRTKEELMKEYGLPDDLHSFCTAFSDEVVSQNGKRISAKEFRMYFKGLPDIEKGEVLDIIYASEGRQTNMRRLPPSRLASDLGDEKLPNDILAKLVKYYMLGIYDSFKGGTQFKRFNKMLESYNIADIFPQISTYSQLGFLINHLAMNSVIEELGKFNGSVETSPLNLPSGITIGVEIECIGANKEEFYKTYNTVLSKYGVDFLVGFDIKKDGSVKEFMPRGDVLRKGEVKRKGIEVASPVLTDTEESWERLRRACVFLNALGMRANKTCGGHIHTASETLGYDAQAWINWRDLCRESQPLIYMLANRRGEKIRNGADTFAAPTPWSQRKVSTSELREIKITNDDELRKFISEYIIELRGGAFLWWDELEFDRYRGFNFDNIGNKMINTIEHRYHNDSTKYPVTRENVILDTRPKQVAKMRAVSPMYKKEEWNCFFEPDLTEKEKLERFLNLVFDSEEEKSLFRERWKHMAGKDTSVKHREYSYKRQTTPEVLPKEKKRKRKNKNKGSDVER